MGVTARFVAAMAAAFAIVFAAEPSSSRAEGLFDFLFGSDSPGSSAPSSRQPPYMRERGAPGGADAKGDGKRDGSPGSIEQFADGFCVRTCDGYFFPLIKSAQATRQQTCEFACPSAPMAIYEGASIEFARNHKGERYSALPTAFSFRDKTTQRCACNEPRTSHEFFQRTVRTDPTLRAGDVVIDNAGAYVYRGSEFVPLERASFVPSETRLRLRSILRRAGGRSDALDAAPVSTTGRAAPADAAEPDLTPTGSTPAAAATTETTGAAAR